MRTHIILVAAIGAATLINTASMAQGPVDIRMVREEDRVRVEVIPTTPEEGIIGCLVFTLRWVTGTIQGLGAPEIPKGLPISVQPSGPVHMDGPFSYRIYAGFGMMPLSSSGMAWSAGTAYTVASIPVIGAGEVELVNDTWTKDPMNNGDHFISIGGEDRTGEIVPDRFALAIGTQDEQRVTISPNPNDGRFTIGFQRSQPGASILILRDAGGREVFRERISGVAATRMTEVDIRGQAAGTYTLTVEGADQKETHRVLVR